MITGRQTPTFEKIGEYAESWGSEVAEMFEEDGGATFYPSQRYELDLMLARSADGSPAATTIGISKPRQNGKSYAARYYAVYMAVFEHRNVLYSAHHSTTTNKMFMALCDLFESPERYPEFVRDVKSVSHSRGFEGFYFNDWRDANGRLQKGGCIEFATRTNSGARGGTYSVIIIDEAQEMTDEQQEAMLPTTSAASDAKDVSAMPQQIYIGTPPNATCKGTVFSKMHAAAHDDPQSSIWWLEWSIDGKSLEEMLPDRETALECARQTNPAYGYRIAESTIINEFDNMSLDGFARERCGWWPPKVAVFTDYAIPQDVWDACAANTPKPNGKTAFGVKFTADGSEVALCGAVVAPNGYARIELIDRRPTGLGMQWLAEWLNARYDKASCVVIDGKNGVDALVDKIKPTWKHKDSVIRPTAKSVIAAVSMLTDSLNMRTTSWYAPQKDLRESAITSIKRPISGGWGFGGENSAPIEACALAYWGAKTSKRDPTRKMRIG